MLLAHALFKAALFLVVGIVDHSTGTRDLRELSGLGRRMPVTAAAAGSPPPRWRGYRRPLGFVAKEAGLEGVSNLGLGGDGAGLAPLPAWALISAIVFGSAITVAYSLRFWWGAFATKPGRQRLPGGPPAGGRLRRRPGAARCWPAWPVDSCGDPLTAVLHAVRRDPADRRTQPRPALFGAASRLRCSPSALAIAGGAVMFWQRDRIAAVQRTFPPVPAAADFYRETMRRIDPWPSRSPARTQRGSLAHYVGTILRGADRPALRHPGSVEAWPPVRLADNGAQVVVGGLMVATAVLVAGSRGRLRAVLLVGVTGYGTALLFLLHGAPDLALDPDAGGDGLAAGVRAGAAQAAPVLHRPAAAVRPLVEDRDRGRASASPSPSSRWSTLGSRVATPVSEPFHETAESFGYGNNIVNVILVDIRAWDTLGEIVGAGASPRPGWPA